jgi:hypothetical protein
MTAIALDVSGGEGDGIVRLHDGVDLDVVAGGRRRRIGSVETPRSRSRHLAPPASLASPTTGSDAMRPRFAQNS